MQQPRLFHSAGAVWAGSPFKRWVWKCCGQRAVLQLALHWHCVLGQLSRI
jgi:hypothetical protein